MSKPETSSSTSPDSMFGNRPTDLIRCALDAGMLPQVTASGPPNWEPPSAAHLQSLLPGFTVERLLGRGGMGAVYQGVQTSLGRTVAVKLLPSELAAGGDFTARFRREAQTLASLQHPGIVAVHDFGQTSEGHLYFVMEFVDGTDLQHIIHDQGLEPDQALEITIQICEALHYAHRQGVVHRDIKPANVLITREGRAKLADFGLARPLAVPHSGMTAGSLIMGTPGYMAPEQWDGSADHRADIYSLGVMLYEMLTGTRPQGAFDPPSARAAVDARLDEVVVRAMRQEPGRRYQEVSELRDAVEKIRTSTPVTPPDSSTTTATGAGAAPEPQIPRSQPVSRPPRGYGRAPSFPPLLSGLVAVLLLLSLAAAVVWLNRSQSPRHDESIVSVPPAPASPPSSPASEEGLQPEPGAESGRPLAVTAPEPLRALAPSPAPLPEASSNTPLDASESPPDSPRNNPASPSAAAPAPSMPAAKPEHPPERPVVLHVFRAESQNLMAWALAPIDEDSPGDLRQKLTFLREDLIDEGRARPAASIEAYRAAYFLCEAIASALNERDGARVSAGFRAAQVAANQAGTNQALEARRNYLMSWPQYSREQSQRDAHNAQSQSRENLAREGQKVAWSRRTEQLRRQLDSLYRQFREALREP